MLKTNGNEIINLEKLSKKFGANLTGSKITSYLMILINS